MSIIRFFYKWDSLKRKILDIKNDIKRLVKINCSERFFITYYGAYDIDPKHLVFWICIQTDYMKSKMQNDIGLNNELRKLLDLNKYPDEARRFVFIGFESQETVDRESKGNWWYHFK